MDTIQKISYNSDCSYFFCLSGGARTREEELGWNLGRRGGGNITEFEIGCLNWFVGVC